MTLTIARAQILPSAAQRCSDFKNASFQGSFVSTIHIASFPTSTVPRIHRCQDPLLSDGMRTGGVRTGGVRGGGLRMGGVNGTGALNGAGGV